MDSQLGRVLDELWSPRSPNFQLHPEARLYLCSHWMMWLLSTQSSVSLVATTAGRSHIVVAVAVSPAASHTELVAVVVWLHRFPNRQFPLHCSTRNSDGTPVVQLQAQGECFQIAHVAGSQLSGAASPPWPEWKIFSQSRTQMVAE